MRLFMGRFSKMYLMILHVKAVISSDKSERKIQNNDI